METCDSFKWEKCHCLASETLQPVHFLNIKQTFQKIMVDITISQPMIGGKMSPHGDMSAKLYYATSCIFLNTFKVKGPVSDVKMSRSIQNR